MIIGRTELLIGAVVLAVFIFAAIILLTPQRTPGPGLVVDQPTPSVAA